MAEAVKVSRYGYRDLDEVYTQFSQGIDAETGILVGGVPFQILDRVLREQARQRREDADALANCADY